ncbi:hypothetical protein KFL_001170180 [Klebsormidium nitens]|uniref:Uncharacterized protein n=1 Tax=Klebsormidium nitens TaxID=105231 RepID=A0A1Y1HVF9_KLENI|nr:hypothetical protein KFL_001170180 [Klebsormidium nitens]|eukprot:GAQ82614.1 hypothetical protein KFL_001170180 [Klebsormidium nitens]
MPRPSPRSPGAKLERGPKKRAPGVLLKRESFEDRWRIGGFGGVERPRRAGAAGIEEFVPGVPERKSSQYDAGRQTRLEVVDDENDCVGGEAKEWEPES